MIDWLEFWENTELPEKYWAKLEEARDDGNENVRDLHPYIAYRTYLVIEEAWNIYGHRSVTIESAVRTRDEQIHLWNLRQAGQFPAAVANPYAFRGNTVIGPMYGSWHMEQRTGFGYAVDLTRPLNKLTWAQLHQITDMNGLRHEVPKEPWHFQANNSRTWFSGPVPPLELPPDLPLPTEENSMVIQPCHDPVTQDQAVLWTDEKGFVCYDKLDKKGTQGTAIDNLLPLCNLHFVKKG